VNDETYRMDRRARKGQAVRFPSLKRRPLRSGLNDNEVAAETFLQVSRSQHKTQRAEGWLHGSRAPTGLLLAGESGCAADL
jgi:hypothetical protein